ncbi:MAG TPA: LysR family transcriptional regulator [Gammaproteobacteria bacterium]
MSPCTLRQLEIFVAAAGDCHFARTANRLGISQAAVSDHIAALERRIGKSLFIRRPGKRPLLSSHGLALLGQAQSLIAEADRIRDFGARLTTPKRVTVRVCAGAHLLDDCIKPRLSQFHRQHRGFDLECHYVDAPSRGVQLVRDGRMELLVFTVADPAVYPLHAEVLRPVRFGLYASKRFASMRHASPAELSALPFILPPEGTEACRMVQTALLEAGIVCRNVAARAQFPAVGKDMAKQGEGVVALYETMIGPSDLATLFEFDVELPRMYRTLFRAERVPDPAIRTVEQFLRSALVH